MNKLSLKKKEMIDIFYGEAEETSKESKQSSDDIAFQHKLTTALNAMDIPDYQTDNIKIQATISDIIDMACYVKARRKNRLELAGFIAASIVLLISFCFITISIGADFFIYIQLITFLFIPLSLIPLAKIAVNKGGVQND
jgi:hypothetical protein